MAGDGGSEQDELAFLKTKAKEGKHWSLVSSTLLEESKLELRHVRHSHQLTDQGVPVSRWLNVTDFVTDWRQPKIARARRAIGPSQRSTCIILIDACRHNLPRIDLRSSRFVLTMKYLTNNLLEGLRAFRLCKSSTR